MNRTKIAALLLTAALALATAGRVTAAPGESPNPWELMRRYAQLQNRLAATTITPARTLHFPTDRSLGAIYTKDAFPGRVIASYFYWTDTGGDWQPFCQATGDVTIPAGKLARLSIAAEQWRDLSPLDRLAPDDIYGLAIYGSYQGGPRPTDAVIPHVVHLTGLKDLTLEKTAISVRALSELRALQQLEYLNLGDSATDAVIAQLKSLPNLKGLYINENRMTNAGLAHLKDFPALEELALGQGRMTDKGLIQLAGCRHLYYLLLSGTNFTDYGMVYIKNIPSLRILHAGSLSHLTDLGLKNVSTASQLQRLSVHWADAITDKGIEYLTAMPDLRMFDSGHGKITNVGASYLARITTLENLSISAQNISDPGLAAMSNLTNLRRLRLTRVFYVDPNKDSNVYTDLGVEQMISRCRRLEELAIGSIGMTDKSLEAIATLPNLKSLALFGVSRVTSKGFAYLGNLTSLESLDIVGAPITLADLPRLRSLPALRQLDVTGISRGGVNLDLSGFRSLEKLSLSLARKPKDHFTDADLAGLADCTSLKWLQIGPRKYSDEGMDYIARLTKLERLGIGGPMLTDAGLQKLRSLKNLNHLTIMKGKFTDNAVGALSGLIALAYLNVPSCPAFDARAQRRLKSALPNLTYIAISPPQSR